MALAIFKDKQSWTFIKGVKNRLYTVTTIIAEDPLEKEVATHSSFLACEIPWTEEPGGLQSMGSEDSDIAYRLNHYHYHRRRKTWGPLQVQRKNEEVERAERGLEQRQKSEKLLEKGKRIGQCKYD